MFKYGPIGKMFGRQTMFERVWLPIMFYLDKTLHMTRHTSVSCSEKFV